MAAGLIISSVAIGAISYFQGNSAGEMVGSATWLKWMQLIQSLGLFIFPVFLMAFLSTSKPLEFLKLSTAPNLKQTCLTVLSMIVAMPFMDFIIQWNQAIHFPDFLQPVEQWMRIKEEQANLLTEKMLEASSWKGWLFNFFIVAISAAFSEELFFRGTLQQYFSMRCRVGVAIILSAFIFSAIHFQFFGFIPRFLLGAYFGYLLYWSQSLWLPILAHFTNNAIALLQIFLFGSEDTPLLPASVPPYVSYLAGVASLILFIFIARAIHRLSADKR